MNSFSLKYFLFSEGQAQIQLELAEHEVQVLRSKLQKAEEETERLLAHRTLLEAQVRKAGGRTTFSEGDYAQAIIPDSYYKQKIKVLEVSYGT